MDLAIHHSFSLPSETLARSRMSVPGLLLTTILSFGCLAAWNAAGAAQPAAAPVSVTPRSYSAFGAFEELARQGGPKVLTLRVSGELRIPAELRFKPVEGRTLVEKVAATCELKVAWAPDGKYAILFAGDSDQEVAAG
ncbi:MAG: hypothetical protein ABSE73_29240 [Planctomycetota bacterium]